jgi:hypothetical protein
MKPGTLTNFFQKTGTYVNMTPRQQNIAEKNTKPKKKQARPILTPPPRGAFKTLVAYEAAMREYNEMKKDGNFSKQSS